MQTRRLLFKLNAATSEEDSLPGPLELGELPFISKRVGGGRFSLKASRRRRFFRISLLFLSSLPMDHTGFFWYWRSIVGKRRFRGVLVEQFRRKDKFRNAVPSF